MKNISVVILAAGEGTRMKSATPKVLHALAGKPLVQWVLSAVGGLKPDRIYLVVGYKSAAVKEALAAEKNIVFVEQKQQLGSGHALRQVEKHLKGYKGDVVVLCADTPLVRTRTLAALLAFHRKAGNSATVLSGCFKNPFGYGRIVRAPSGQVQGIVEEKDASPDEKLISEINSGIYCFKSPAIWKAVDRIKNNNAKKEYYLTDALALLDKAGDKVGAWSGVTADEILGINDRLSLAGAEEIMRRQVLAALMAGGVTIVAPQHTYIQPGVKIGQDSVIYPGTVIEGTTVIGAGCAIGPYSFIKDSVVADGVEIRMSQVTGARLETGVKVGPFSHLRPGAVIKKGARVGNFSEVKKSVVGEGSKVNHLSYIGDSILGRDVNVGAGTITCNYDGVRKSQTLIGDRVFVGSNVNLVAPVKIGDDVLLAAGSTITDDVPKGVLAIARSRQVHKQKKK